MSVVSGLANSHHARCLILFFAILFLVIIFSDLPAEEKSPTKASGESAADAVLSECLQHIVSTFSTRQPNLVADTRLFVSELLRISLLWTEAWMQALSHWQAHVTRLATL